MGAKKKAPGLMAWGFFVTFASSISIQTTTFMKRIEVIIERSKDLFTAYSNNCEGIYGAGNTIEEVKEDVRTSIEQIKREIPEERWPDEIKGEYELSFELDNV